MTASSEISDKEKIMKFITKTLSAPKLYTYVRYLRLDN